MQTALPYMALICLTNFISTHGQWVDPHSMDSNAKQNIPKQSQTYSNYNKNCECTNKCHSDIHMRQIIRSILSNAHLDNDESGFHSGYLNIRLSDKEYKLLMDFVRSAFAQENVYFQVSSIMEDALETPALERYQKFVLGTGEKLAYFIFNATSGVLAGACFFAYAIYKLLQARFTWKAIIKIFLVFMYVADFAITYLHILHDEEINSMVLIKQFGAIPPECDPKKMSWWAYTKLQLATTFSENPCKAYYKATFQDFKYFVAPSLVLSRQFKTLILDSFGDIGEAFGKFGRGMFTSLPWGLNIVIFPILLIGVLVFLFILILFITKPHFKLSLFHLFSIELGQAEVAPKNRPQIRGRNKRPVIRHTNGAQVGVDENSRKFIEDVSNASSSPDQPVSPGTSDKSPTKPTSKDNKTEEEVSDSGTGNKTCSDVEVAV